MTGFLWGLRRTSMGKKFGNEIADSMGIPRRVFHTAIELGGMEMHLVFLAVLKDEGKSINEAREEMLPILMDGLYAMEARFGTQMQITDSIETVMSFLSKSD